MDEQQQWYVTIAGNAVGPVSTDLVLRGIKHKKIATGAYVCVVGASEWLALTDVPEFHGALKENGLLPASVAEDQPVDSGASGSSAPSPSIEEDDEFETTSQFSSRELMESAAGPQSQQDTPGSMRQSAARQVGSSSGHPEAELLDGGSAMGDDSVDHASTSAIAQVPDPVGVSDADAATDDRSADTTQVAALAAPQAPVTEHEPIALEPGSSQPLNGKHAAAPEMQSLGVEVDIDVHIAVDEPEAATIDWNHGFSEYFLVDANITLPDEQLLLRSLSTTPHETFLHDEPMWNLALCLAFGSNAVASVAADVFFDVVAANAQHERIEWMARTLLSRGFMPSGIPHAAGNLGIGRLRQACPDELRMQLESQLGI